MFDMQKGLDKIEAELNGYPNKGFKFQVDRQDYSQSVGAGGYWQFKVYALYQPHAKATPARIVTGFYAALSAFLDNGRLDNGEADININQKAMGPLEISAKVTIPMTYKDFGDQI